jgi:hypothetical protein
METHNGWNHEICPECWNKRNPGSFPHQMIPADAGVCCFCGRVTWSGIYVREDPNSPALMCRPKASVEPTPVLTTDADDSVSPIDAGIVVAEALTEILTDIDSGPDSVPDVPADTPFDGFGGGSTGGGGADGDF